MRRASPVVSIHPDHGGSDHVLDDWPSVGDDMYVYGTDLSSLADVEHVVDDDC